MVVLRIHVTEKVGNIIVYIFYGVGHLSAITNCKVVGLPHLKYEESLPNYVGRFQGLMKSQKNAFEKSDDLKVYEGCSLGNTPLVVVGESGV